MYCSLLTYNEKRSAAVWPPRYTAVPEDEHRTYYEVALAQAQSVLRNSSALLRQPPSTQLRLRTSCTVKWNNASQRRFQNFYRPVQLLSEMGMSVIRAWENIFTNIWNFRALFFWNYGLKWDRQTDVQSDGARREGRMINTVLTALTMQHTKCMDKPADQEMLTFRTPLS